MRSFQIDHRNLIPGIYEHSKSGLVTTWDIRMKYPNKGEYLTPEIIHTIEHTLAFFLREKFGDYRIVGIFPMGCQTGFYILTRFISRVSIVESINDYSFYIHGINTIPGATEGQCGQYLLQDLEGARKELLKFDSYIKSMHVALKYNK